MSVRDFPLQANDQAFPHSEERGGLLENGESWVSPEYMPLPVRIGTDSHHNDALFSEAITLHHDALFSGPGSIMMNHYLAG